MQHAIYQSVILEMKQEKCNDRAGVFRVNYSKRSQVVDKMTFDVTYISQCQTFFMCQIYQKYLYRKFLL